MTKLSENKQLISLAIKGVIPFLFVALFLLGFPSCEKKAGQIGYIIQPEDSKLEIGYSDSTFIHAYSVLIDSIRSDRLTNTALGCINDPVFGKTIASFYTTFTLSINEKDFGDDNTLDSLVLQLYYQGAYADTNAVLNVQVYEIIDEDTLTADSSYYSNLELEIDNINYADYSFMPRPNDSVVVDGDTLPPLIRINLTDVNPNLGQYLLDADTNVMEDTETFRDYFKGLYVTVENVSAGDGTFAYFGLSSSYSKMTLYYNDSVSYDYNITTSTPTVGKYDHDYSTADNDFKQQVVFGDTTLGDKILYTSGFSAARTYLKFPYLNKWARKENVAVNEAKLIIPGADVEDFYGAPDQLTMLEINEDHELELLIDYDEGASYFDGYYDEDRNQYVFRITRYIQSYISDTTLINNGIYLQVYGASTVPERFVIKGHDVVHDSLEGIRLELLYTDL